MWGCLKLSHYSRAVHVLSPVLDFLALTFSFAFRAVCIWTGFVLRQGIDRVGCPSIFRCNSLCGSGVHDSYPLRRLNRCNDVETTLDLLITISTQPIFRTESRRIWLTHTFSRLSAAFCCWQQIKMLTTACKQAITYSVVPVVSWHEAKQLKRCGRDLVSLTESNTCQVECETDYVLELLTKDVSIQAAII